MKVMAGYDTRNKTDWRAKAAEEVGKVQQKAKLLEENLQRYKPGDQIEEGDVFEVSCPLNSDRYLLMKEGTGKCFNERPAKDPENVRRRIG
jgi:hypothetical protein